MKLKKKILIIGSGKHSKVVKESAQLLKLIFYKKKKNSKNKSDIMLEKNIRKNKKNILLHIAIGSNSIRKKVFNFYKKKGYSFCNIVDPSSIVSKSAKLSPGIFVAPGSIINGAVKIGSNSIINSGSIIEHHTIIKKNSHIAPGVKILGSCKIGESCLIGAGSVINSGIRVGDFCTVGLGSGVIKDCDKNSVYVGLPAKKIK